MAITGGNALYLNGANTYSGGTTLGGGGSVNFGTGTAFGSGTITWNTAAFIQPSVSSALTIGNAMTHGAYSGSSSEAFSGGTGGVTFSGPWTLSSSGSVLMRNVGGAITVSGAIGGGSSSYLLGLTNYSGASWTFSGVNTYTSGTLITNNTSLTIAGAGQLGSGAYARNIGIGSSGKLIYASSAAQTLSGVVSGAGSLTVSNNASLTLTGVNTYSGGTTNLAGSTLTISGSGSLGSGTYAGTISNGGTFVYASSAAQTLSGSIYGTTGTLEVNNSAANLTLSGSVSSPNVTIASGELTLNHAGGPFPASSIITFGGSGTAGTLEMNGRNQTVSGLVVAGGATASSQTIQNSTALGSNPTLTFQTGTSTFGGSINSVGTGLFVLKVTSGSLTLGGANSYNGGTTITGGTLDGSVAGSIPGNVTSSGGTFELDDPSAMSSSATLTLASSPGAGAVFLNFSGTQTISALNFGSTSMAQGTWGSSTSGAAHQNAAFTGNGLLNVTSGGATPTIAAPVMTPNLPCAGATVSLTATVSGGNAPSGSVQFFDGATSLGTGTLVSGTATLSPAVSFSAGSHTLTAQYLGDNQNNPSAVSSPLVVTVGVAPTISAQPANTTVCSGSTATFNVTAAGSGLSYSWAQHNNGGWGNAWSVSGNGSTFLGSSTDNDQGNPDCNSLSSAGDINSTNSGYALGLWGGNDGSEVATRAFPALAVGQVVSIDFDNGDVDNGSKVGFSLQTSGGAADVLQFYFLGGQSNYKYSDDVNGEQDSGIGWGYTGLRVQFVLTSASTYTLIVTPCGGTATTLTGTYSGAAIAQAKLFNGNTGNGNAENCYFNNFIIGGYVDNADNYSGSDFAGLDEGDQPIASANGSTYTTAALGVGDSGSQDQVVVYGCAGAVLSSAATVTVNPLPTVSVNPAAVCAGGSATLTATTSANSPSYLWNDPANSTTASITVSPASTTTYTVTVTDGTTGCANSGSGTVTVNPLPAVSVNSAAVCAGGSATLTATTDASSPTYQWNDPANSTTASITVSPASTTTYTVTVTDGTTGCANSGSGTVTVNPLPAVSVNSAAVCAGGSATLTATTDASSPSYLWNDPANSTTASITVSPASTTTYTVTVTDGTTGCANSGSGTVTVNPVATVTTDTTNQTVCAGSEVTWLVVASGAGQTYQWQRDGTNLLEGVDNFTGTTTATLTNSAVGAQDAQDTNVVGQGYACIITIGSCSVSSTLASLTVNPLPTVSVNSAAVCAGGSATLTATTSANSPSYQWNDPANSTTASITVSPASTTTYTVMVTDGTTGCANSGSGTVTVTPLPAVSVNSAAVCAGGSATLTATTDASSPTYQWNDPANSTTASITVSPATTTTYTVTVTDGTTGCVNSGSGTVTVNPLPAVSVNSAAVCAGGSATLTATTDASSPSYLWNDPANSTTASITVSPATTTTYTVTVTDGTTGCANSGSGTVTVNPVATVTTDTTNQTVCAGSEVTWSVVAGGAGQTYQWQRDGTNLLEGVDNFTGTTTATLTNSAVGAQDAQDTNVVGQGYACIITIGSCSVSSTLASLTVNPLPTVSVNSAAVCAGGSATLTATTSANSPSYQWNDPANSTTASITVSPASTTTYTVMVTDGTTGCANSGSGTVTVTPLPAVSVNSAAVCAGGSATLTATTDASSPTYQWNDPANSTTASITVSPASTTTYTVTVTDGTTGCANSVSSTVTVNPLPTASAGSDQMVCSGGPVAIGGSPTASGGTGPYTYSWAPAAGLDDATLANPIATVSGTTTYTVTVTDQNGCTANASVTLTLVPEPVLQTVSVAGTTATLVWSSVAGQTYQVQYTTDLSPTVTWTNLTPTVTATGATATTTDSFGADSQRFYRISVVCP